jgi:IclR family pca regulon transcriptional regulator
MYESQKGLKMENTQSKSKDYLSTLARGLTVIRSFKSGNMSMTLTETAEKNNISRASARRFLLTLQELGYVKSENKKFSLTAKVLDLGYSYLSTLDVEGVVSSHLEQITQQLNQSSSASVLDGYEIVYIARIPVRSAFSFNLQIGARLPAYATAMGRVLLSAYDDDIILKILSESNIENLTPYTLIKEKDILKEIKNIRKQGYSINDQELGLGLRSVAVPVYNQKGKIKLTLNVSTHVSKITCEQLVQEFVPVLQIASQKISAHLP